jgi:succinate dehydrogenase/fumarate reductase flavoprotein subunit
MWHCNAVVGQIAFMAPEVDQAFQVRAVDEAFIWVDKFGRRYINETKEVLHNAWRQVAQYDMYNTLEDGKQWPRVPIYMIFDERMRRKAPISRDWRPDDGYKWSLDNSAEIEKGWIKKADTIVELAKLIGMEPRVLEETVRRFNDYCRTGVDEEFGREAKTMYFIQEGPFYAMPWIPCMISTAGGAEHDARSRVLDNDGKPIPRLYAAGEVSTAVGWLYEAGFGHSEQIIFGRLAGENASKETPLT